MDDVYEQARQLQSLNQHEGAEKLYRQFLKQQPDSFKALNNLGAVLRSQDKLVEAESCFRRASELAPHESIPKYNLGLALFAQQQFEAAVVTLKELLDLDSDNVDARLKLAIACWRTGDLVEAENQFRTFDHDEGEVGAAAASEMGRMFFETERYHDALNCQLRAVGLDDTAEHRFHLALGCRALGAHDKAIEELRCSIKMDPTSWRVHEHLVRALRATEKSADEINAAFAAWEEAHPGNPVRAHMHSAWSGDENVERASAGYVRQTFSGFAETFDTTLLKLDYQVWSLLAARAARLLAPNTLYARVLDMGCGTGLSGVPLRDMADVLIGVDIAEPMLHQARKKAVYDELIEADLVDYFQPGLTPFDLVVASDTLNYFGKLGPLFGSVAGAMTVGGRFIFSIEHSAEDLNSGYQIQGHGRFRHTQDYIETELRARGFEQIVSEITELRKENALPVLGLIVTAQRTRDD